jgi:ribosome recycling factor
MALRYVVARPALYRISIFVLPTRGSCAMSVDEVLLDAEERMEKAVSVLKHSLSGIRTGRATPGLVDSVRVEAYGSQSPLKQLASIGAPEPNQLVIRPYDAGTIKDIEKAIVSSDLGLNPQNDGKIIRINIPPLSTDVRKKMVSRIKELAEEAKIAVRSIRRDANKAIETAEKDKEIGEDDRDRLKEEVQELTKKYEAEATESAKAREADVMED